MTVAGGRSTRTRVLRILGWTVLGLVLALYIGFPLAMAATAVWPSRAEVGSTPDGFEEVNLKTADGDTLAAWYREPENGAAIILLHGAGGSRENMKGHAEMLAENGYGVLSVDLRGHGESEGRTNRVGWQGTADVEAAVEFLRERDGVERIGAIGSSMGGEVLLGASAECPEIEAMVADGATRRSTEELLALPSERPLVRNFTARVMYAGVRVLAARRPPAPLLEEMRRSESTSFLLIAAGENDLEVRFNELFADGLGGRASLWIVPGVGHTKAYSEHPEEYRRRILGFLDEHLLTGDR